MGSQIYSPSPQFSTQLPKTKSRHISSFSSLQLKPRISIISSQQQPQSAGAVTETTIPRTGTYNVDFKTFEACKLGISRYPDFVYNAKGGSGTGTGKRIESSDEIAVDFDLEKLYIPPLTSATAKFLGLPLPPFLKIDVVPELLRGYVNQETGKVNLEFKAKFWFSVGTIYRAPPLLVETLLTSEETKGRIREGRGERLNEEGRCKLVGVATVEPIDDSFMNTFLSLPTECLAKMNARISFSST
ncbi:uncharacterized protein LOC107770827 [Nicotiana tabacum]|uniref:Uncharacterized protein LOC107770827 n=2 Tax=Nicotiana TaxID=4085 RepID=A0A1S3Y0K5_TOBAC|nr:PREDICTED: uncharacterized protein LOC104235342 [Nicotiana sylvestris]XP_016445644.1 PREDICTED: uncharacterized protein LOC107770827 [Nicotiana tabacum]